MGLVVGLVLSVCALRAHAQEHGPDAYRTAIEQALSEYAAANYEEAAALFARAHALEPSARTLRGMGMASFELRRYPESVEQLEAALASDVRPLDGTLRREAEQLLERARAFVGQLRLTLEPAHAAVSVDGRPVPQPMRGPLLLRVGDHLLEANAAGYEAERRDLRVRGGEQITLTVRLAPEAERASTPLLARADHDSRSEPRPLRKNPWLWAAVGAAVVGGVVASVLVAGADREQRIVPIEVAGTTMGETLTAPGR